MIFIFFLNCFLSTFQKCPQNLVQICCRNPEQFLFIYFFLPLKVFLSKSPPVIFEPLNELVLIAATLQTNHCYKRVKGHFNWTSWVLKKKAFCFLHWSREEQRGAYLEVIRTREEWRTPGRGVPGGPTWRERKGRGRGGIG